VTLDSIRAAVRELDLSHRALCVHASLRSFGWVDGGPMTIIEGLLAEGCTVMVPTFSWTYAIDPPEGMRPPRNAWDYDSPPDVPRRGTDLVYMPDCNDIDEESMGAVPAALVRLPGRKRGNHPLGSLSAVGPLAEQLVTSQGPLSFFAPFEVLAETAGGVVLMGVNLTSMTLLHLAEKMAGRTPFRRWANGPDGRPMMVEAGGCGQGFCNLVPALSHLTRECRAGLSTWRAFPAKETLEAAAEAIRKEPLLTHCGGPKCGRCRDAVAGGPLLDGEADDSVH